MENPERVYTNFNELAAHDGALEVHMQSRMSTFNAPHYLFADGNGGMDFYMESYAGDDDRFPGIPPVKKEDGTPFTPEDRKAFRMKYAMPFSSNAFYGIADGKIYQYNPQTGYIEVGNVGERKGYGDKLPDGWRNYAREV